MNFFEHQAKARRNTKGLMVMFMLAVAGIVAAIAVVVAVSLEMAAEGEQLREGGLFARHQVALVLSTLVTLTVIGVATLYKTARLRSGGGVVARQMGGTLLTPETRNPAYRRLRNVVEEIAIASGVPVPEIYVLEQENAINAFAAGFTPADAAIGVTRGAVERLTRDELQGVIAHEYSHVLNGDMRLNIRLMGVLFGILVIGIVAREFLRHSRGARGKGGGALVLAALGIMVIGFIGLFFGRLIKARVSREREFLADASAVQFTRQGDGIAGALKKIGGLAQGSKLEAHDAEEVSHMLFGDGVGYSSLFATHPPLIERIKRIDRNFDPRELAELARSMSQAPAAAGVEGAEEMPIAAAAPMPGAGGSVGLAPAAVTEQVGNPAADDYNAAGVLIAGIPERLHAAAHMQSHAAAIVLGLALDSDQALRGRQLDLVAQSLGAPVREATEGLAPQLQGLHPMQRLPLAELAFPALRRQPRPFLKSFVEVLEKIIHADGKVQLDEYCLAKLVGIQVVDALDPSRAKVMGKRKLSDCIAEAAALLATVARHGSIDAGQARHAYVAGASGLLPGTTPPYAPPPDSIAALDAALPVLNSLDPAGKQLVVEALTRTMSHDDRITVAEAELLRIICAALHCPLPPQLAAAA